MPRKMAGIAMITIEASIVAIVMLRVVLDSATHRYRSGFPSPPGVPFADSFRCPDSTLRRTLTQSTPNHLLNGNYISGPVSGGGLAVASVRRPGGGAGRPGSALEDVIDRG